MKKKLHFLYLQFTYRHYNSV